MPNWRIAFKSDFLASWDLDSNVIITIQKTEVKGVILTKKDPETKVIVSFVEKTFANGEVIKPMILNATNCKTLNLAMGTKETNNWSNIQVEIGVVANTGRIGAANGLKILRVLSTGLPDKLPELETLFKKASDYISEEESNGIDNVIKSKIVAQYEKCINFLKSKIPADA